MRRHRRNTATKVHTLLTGGAALLISCLLTLAVSCQDLASDASSTGSSATATTETETGTGTTETTETDLADSDSGGHDGPAPDDDDGSIDDPETGDDEADAPAGSSTIGTAFFITTTEDRTIRDRWTFDDSDNNQRRTVRTRDYITVELDYPRYRQVTSTTWRLGGSSTMITNHGFDVTRTLLGDYVTHVTYEFFVEDPGDCTLMILSYHERDHEYHVWQVYLTAAE